MYNDTLCLLTTCSAIFSISWASINLEAFSFVTTQTHFPSAIQHLCSSKKVYVCLYGHVYLYPYIYVGYLESKGHVVNNPGSDCVDLICLWTRRPQGCCKLKPMYVAITNKCDFVFSKTYKVALYKLTVGTCRMALRLPNKLQIPRLATDATLSTGPISHTIGRSVLSQFSKTKAIHIRELLALLVAIIVIKPKAMLTN